MKHQKGFTLIEMAVVLVIIGLLIGGIFKGQQLIETANIKSTMNDMANVTAAYQAYYDRFRQMPGDDGSLTTLQARGGAWSASVSSALTAGDTDGVLDVTSAQTFTGAGENATLFQHLRAAGFLAGSANDVLTAALPRNGFGGLLGMTGNAVTGMPANGKYLCAGSIPGKAARAIDLAKDDGVANTGSLRATEGGSNIAPGTAATTYDDGSVYTICLSL
jgi:prepilin-type N-terminal cleavage/methylation domain-containing protein